MTERVKTALCALALALALLAAYVQESSWTTAAAVRQQEPIPSAEVVCFLP